MTGLPSSKLFVILLLLSVDTLSISTIPVPHFPSFAPCPTPQSIPPLFAALASTTRITFLIYLSAYQPGLFCASPGLKDPLVPQDIIFPPPPPPHNARPTWGWTTLLSVPFPSLQPHAPTPSPPNLSLFVTFHCLVFTPAGRTLSNDSLSPHSPHSRWNGLISGTLVFKFRWVRAGFCALELARSLYKVRPSLIMIPSLTDIVHALLSGHHCVHAWAMSPPDHSFLLHSLVALPI
ncbi:hypothetical protein NLI96_g7043 [Meripilus lineatus]|uniref:Uncharacterized protein n=1 Tax=Meripilus lineatus TaxID=2056292 RepID=A0AAD5YHL9_9APHY|nr:hypothetical protein NLI96_g7043 [Physisporinus lineatus]